MRASRSGSRDGFLHLCCRLRRRTGACTHDSDRDWRLSHLQVLDDPDTVGRPKDRANLSNFSSLVVSIPSSLIMLSSRLAGSCARSPGVAAGRLALSGRAATARPHRLGNPCSNFSDPLQGTWARPGAFSITQSQSSSLHSTALRSSKGGWAAQGPISYEELKPLTQAPPLDLTIIDVREPDEVLAGIIPSAVSVPLSQFDQAFNSNKAADFRKKFAFDRPAFDDKIVFYCRSGKRSQQALEFATKNGWNK